jgi:hypothetical protein
MRERYRPVVAPEIDLIFFAFMLNFVWEFLQAPLFSSMRGMDHISGIYTCLLATLGDVGIALGAFWIVAFVTTGRTWIGKPSIRAVALFLMLGLVATVALEYLHTEITLRWRYADIMPRLPFLGTGIAPLLQWIVVPLTGLWFLRRLSA